MDGKVNKLTAEIARAVMAWGRPHFKGMVSFNLLCEAIDAVFARERPANVTRLVIAARVVAFGRRDADAIRELDQASEAFASLVPWDDEPTAQETPTRQRQDRNGLGPKDGGSVGNADAPETGHPS